MIEKLRQLNQIDIQNQWKPSPLTSLPQGEGNQPSPLTPLPQGEGNKGYITWNKGRELLILTQKIVIPEHINNYPIKGLSLRLILTWWAEKAEIFINDDLVQVGDLFDSSVRLLLTPHSIPGTEINIKLHLISPIHDQGALMKSICLYESNYPLDSHIDPTFFADELTILQDYLPSEFLTSQLELIDFDSLPNLTQFNLSLERIKQNILNCHLPLPNHTIYLLGHSHLDLAWLWNVNETWQVAQNTFTSVLNLQKDYPDLIFAHSTPALYLWLENNRPDLFAEITEQV
ncbi:MAG TPA: alpha-mannosidase, partial [Allocoleopsis sp.]